jgi:hypothetical protein
MNLRRSNSRSAASPLRAFRSTVVCGIAACLCFGHSIVQAKEVDQFTDRRAVLAYFAGGYRQIEGAPGPADVDRVLDARMNWLLDRLASRLRDAGGQSQTERDAVAREVFQHRFLPELITPYEAWVEEEAAVPLYRVRDKGVYGNAVNYDDMRMVWYIELSSMIQVAGVLIGTDKLGHFIAQGFQYYQWYEQLDRSLSVEARCAAIRARGHVQEYGQLGVATGGVYSFADLASNWAGMLFFMALFDDVSIEGEHHAHYLERAAEGGFRRVRDFHWAEYVTSDWDEVLNPTRVERGALYEKIVHNLWRRDSGQTSPSVCEDYRSDPKGFLGPSQPLRPRSSYAAPAAALRVTPFSLDVQVICARPPQP